MQNLDGNGPSDRKLNRFVDRAETAHAKDVYQRELIIEELAEQDVVGVLVVSTIGDHDRTLARASVPLACFKIEVSTCSTAQRYVLACLLLFFRYAFDDGRIPPRLPM